MKNCYDVGGIIRGPIPKDMKDRPSQDTVDIKGTPGEVIVNLETLDKGPQAWVSFIGDQLKNHNPDLYKRHFQGGGTIPQPYTNNPNNMLYQQGSGQPAPVYQNIVKPPSERLKQLESIRMNLPKSYWTPALDQEYNTLKVQSAPPAMPAAPAQPMPEAIPAQSQYTPPGFACGGTVEKPSWVKGKMGYNKGGTVLDLQPVESEKLDLQPVGSNSAPDTSLGDKAQTALESFGNAATLGYMPQIQAAAAPAIDKAMDVVLGEKSPESTYVQRRDENIQRMAQQEERNPKSALAGKVAGIAATAGLTPEVGVLKGAGILPSIGRGAITGAGYGAAQNPGDVPGEVSPVQASERLENAKEGAKIGAAAGGVGAIVGKGLKTMQNSADHAQEFANTQAVRASGGMLKDFRNLNAKGKVDDIGKFALDNGIVKAGDDVKAVAEKANDFREKAGENLDAIYSKANEAFKNKMSDSLKGAAGANVETMAGFNPVKNKSEIISSIESKMGDSPEKRKAVAGVSEYLDQLIQDHGDQVLSPKDANNIKTHLDSQINYARNPLTKDPAKEQGFSAMRDYVNDAVKKHIDELGQSIGDDQLAAQLKKANKDYGYAKQLQTMSEDRVNRENANRMFGLTDTIAGGTGAIAGGMLGKESGHPAEGALLGLAAGIANKAGRAYAPGVMAAAANKAAPILEKTVKPVAEAISKVPGSMAEKAAIMATGNQNKSSGGYQKWYADGLQNLKDHAESPDDKKMIDSKRKDLVNSPKGQQLLLEASTLKPGSKRLNRVLSDIRGMK